VAEAELVTALLGQAVDVSDLFSAGERIVNLERLFNLRHGASAADDRLPEMFFDREYNAGKEPSKPYEWMEPMIREFYRIMGWDERGYPGSEKLKEFGLTPIRSAKKPAA
jgi:aldehyde:ferredoxin oxidoreductase